MGWLVKNRAHGQVRFFQQRVPSERSYYDLEFVIIERLSKLRTVSKSLFDTCSATIVFAIRN